VKKKLVLFLFLCSHGFNLFSQHELTLYHMNNVFQGSYVNPSLIPENKVSIGLPGISSVYTSTYFSPFVANDLKQKTGNTVVLSMDKAISKMSRYNNYLNQNISVDLFSLRVKVRNLYISLSASNITNLRLNVPKDLFSLVWYGNAQYAGNSVDLKNIGINATQYNEYALGIARGRDGGKFTYGIRLKLLQGLNNFYTQKSSGTVAIDNEFYKHTLSADMVAHSASVIPYDSKDIDYLKAAENFKNLGGAVDLGLSYSPNKKWTISGSANNIGAIVWHTNAKTYSVNGTYQFSGINLDSLIANGQVDSKAILDSLKSSFQLKEESTSKYKTPLTPQFYVSVAYNLGRNTKIALTGYSEFYKGIRPAGSVAFIQRAGRVLNVVLTYNVRKNSYNNMGIGLMIKPGPFQFYIVGDNIVVLNPFNTNNFNLRTGMNLVFGKTRKPEMQTHNEE
jgi:hypothetical protein